MSLRKVWRRRTIAAYVLLAAALACGLGLLLPAAGPGAAGDGSRLAANRARVLTGPVLYALEREAASREALPPAGSEASLPGDEALRLSRDIQADLLVVGNDGLVRFDTSGAAKAGTAFDLRHDLHYDLHAAEAMPERYTIAFPLVADSGAQLGSALFTLRAADVLPPPSGRPALLSAALALCLAGAAAAAALNRRDLRRRIVLPLSELERHAERILRGDYDQAAEYGRADEIGSLYAAFDRMRLEIGALHERRGAQEQAQQELISGISHDLKTPLATMRAYMEAIQAGLCPDMAKVQEYIRVMQSHADKMTRLVDDLLLHALQELGRIAVAPAEVYSDDVLAPIRDSVAHQAIAGGRIFEERTNLPNLLIRADAFRTEQVVSNLLANALKHTRPGDKIGWSVEAIPGYLRVSLSDGGSGIRAEDMPFVFERYFRGRPDGSEAPNAEAAEPPPPGTGLGLAICKQIVEAHGGTIFFRSVPGEETTFSFTLPLA